MSGKDFAPRKVTVIGAGIVGMSIALRLLREGHKVTVVDRVDPGQGTSFGNAGAIVDGSAAPNSTPDTIKSVPSMLFDKQNSPLVIRWRYLPKIAPWLMRFLLEGTPARAEANSIALHAIASRASEGWLSLAKGSAVESMIKPVGWLKVFNNEPEFESFKQSLVYSERRNAMPQLLNADELRQLEPSLSGDYRFGAFWPDARFVINPRRAVEEFAHVFAAEGGKILKREVTSIDTGDGARTVVTREGNLTSDDIVIACGAWSRKLAASLGDDVMLDTERGYHLMLPLEGQPKINRPILNASKYFVLAPMEEGIRLTCKVEFAGLEAPPDYSIPRHYLKLAAGMIPGLDTREQSVWMGYRPSLPDSLPVIGRATHFEGIYYAFGHQHLGLTLGPATSVLIADMIAGREPTLDMTPYRPNR